MAQQLEPIAVQRQAGRSGPPPRSQLRLRAHAAVGPEAGAATGERQAEQAPQSTPQADNGAQPSKVVSDTEQDEGADTTVADALTMLEQTRLDIPVSLDWQRLSGYWEASEALPSDVLPSEAPRRPQQRQDGAESNNHTESDAEAYVRARSEAQRAYAELVRQAKEAQADFVNQANDVAGSLVQIYSHTTSAVTRTYDSAIEELDRQAEQARSEVESAAVSAELHLESTYSDTVLDLDRAAHQAHGAIRANENTAGTQIDTIVSGLVSGHLAAFNGAISETRTAANAAVKSLKDWSDKRSDNKKYDTRGVGALVAAQNESKQQHIPHLSESGQKAVNDRTDRTVHTWESTRDSTICGLSCGYRAPLTSIGKRCTPRGTRR